MRISTKIILGFCILIAVMIGVIGFQITTTSELQRITQNLSEINLNRAREAIDLERDLPKFTDLTKKFLYFKDPKFPEDPQYLQKLTDYEQSIHRILKSLLSEDLTDGERVEVRRLSVKWTQIVTTLARLEAEEVIDSQSSQFGKLMDDVDSFAGLLPNLSKAIGEAMDHEVRRSYERAEFAYWTSIAAAAGALLVSLVVAFLISRSINEPLRHLTEGTRAISEGKFFYRLDTSRKDEFSQVARDFNLMSSRLDELDQMKKDFVSHVSHELKAPLASMQETIHLLLEQIPGPLTQKQERLLKLNAQSGTRLSSMIRNLLDLSRMEAGVLEYELKERDLGALTRAAIAELDAAAKEKLVRVELEIPPTPMLLQCDGDRIIQVIGNVLGNAIKFSPERGSIRVVVGMQNKLSANARQALAHHASSPLDNFRFALIEVTDSGPGVSDEHKKKIFTRFHQVKQGKKISGQGVGLGLAICQTIVEAHRGAIWVENNPGGGSVFRVLLRADSWISDTARASAPL